MKIPGGLIGGWRETQRGVNTPKPGSGQGRDGGQAGGREVTLEKHRLRSPPWT